MLRIGAVLVACGLLLGCVTEPRVPKRTLQGWSRVETSDIRILGDVPPERLLELSEELARFASAAGRILSISEEPPRVPFTILVFRDPELLLRFDRGPWSGFVRSTLGAHYALVASSSRRSETRTVLLHEYMHFLVRKRRRYDYPRWFDEGLAEYMSTLRVRDDVVVVGAPPARLLQRALRTKMPRLEQLFAAEVSLYDLYASGWALVHLAVSDPAHRGKLAALDRRLARGMPLEQASKEAFLGEDAITPDEVDRHLARLARGVRHDLMLPLEELSPGDVGEVRPVSAAEIGYALGYVVLRFGDTSPELATEAARFFRTTLAVAPQSTHARAGLAEALAREGRMEAALEQLDRALIQSDPDVRVRLHAARVWAHRARGDLDTGRAAEAWSTAERWASQALAKEPDSPEAHALLGRAYAARAEDVAARRHLERAVALGTYTPDLQIDLASIAIRQGRRADARARLELLVRQGHRKDLAERAQALLDELPEDPRVPASE